MIETRKKEVIRSGFLFASDCPFFFFFLFPCRFEFCIAEFLERGFQHALGVVLRIDTMIVSFDENE
jgi:hypothetical protein